MTFDFVSNDIAGSEFAGSDFAGSDFAGRDFIAERTTILFSMFLNLITSLESTYIFFRMWKKYTQYIHVCLQIGIFFLKDFEDSDNFWEII